MTVESLSMATLPDFLLHLRHSHNHSDLHALKLNSKHISRLSHHLFNLLHLKFQLFFTSLKHPSTPKFTKIVKDLTPLLRSSLIILTFLDSDQQSLLRKCRYISHILNILCSIDVSGRNGKALILVHNLVSCEVHSSNSQHSISVSLELCHSVRTYLCSLLEVFADECLKHPSLRKYIMYVESFYSIVENNSTFHLNNGYIAIVLEIISAHFMLSVSDEQVVENFISRLLLPCGKDSRDFGLSLESSISLLLNPILLSAPKMLQAHVISLVSETIGCSLPSQNSVSDSLMDCYLIAFEKSINVYSMHTSSLQTDGSRKVFQCSDHSYLLGKSQTTFETYIQQDTKNKLDHVISNWGSSWDSHHCNISSKTKPNLLTECITFMKESQHIFPDSCRKTIFSIVECIICRTFTENAAGDEFSTMKQISAEDICLLTSIFKLMSISLIQATRSLSNDDNSGCLKTLQNASLSKRYDSLISCVSCFQQCNTCLPIQNMLSDVMKSHLAREKHSKPILVHFLGLLASSFIHGFDNLAKACLSVIMALMYLFIFEEESLTALGSLKDRPLQDLPSEIPVAKAREASGNKASYKIAAEFHKFWALHSRRNTPSSFEQIILDDKAESPRTVPIVNPFCYDVEEEACNGEMFLECIYDKSSKSDYADLVDFIECKRGKDYHLWLKNLGKFRTWKRAKVDDRRKKRKKMWWKVLKCSKTSISCGKTKRQKR